MLKHVNLVLLICNKKKKENQYISYELPSKRHNKVIILLMKQITYRKKEASKKLEIKLMTQGSKCNQNPPCIGMKLSNTTANQPQDIHIKRCKRKPKSDFQLLLINDNTIVLNNHISCSLVLVTCTSNVILRNVVSQMNRFYHWSLYTRKIWMNRLIRFQLIGRSRFPRLSYQLHDGSLPLGLTHLMLTTNTG